MAHSGRVFGLIERIQSFYVDFGKRVTGAGGRCNSSERVWGIGAAEEVRGGIQVQREENGLCNFGIKSHDVPFWLQLQKACDFRFPTSSPCAPFFFFLSPSFSFSFLTSLFWLSVLLSIFLT